MINNPKNHQNRIKLKFVLENSLVNKHWKLPFGNDKKNMILCIGNCFPYEYASLLMLCYVVVVAFSVISVYTIELRIEIGVRK